MTLAEVLKTAGYRTAMSGKWHVGDNLSPIERGFDDFYSFTRGYAVDSFASSQAASVSCPLHRREK